MNIREWLSSIELEQYAEVFEENDLGMDDLAELSAEELKDDLGITSLGHRKKIMKALDSLGEFDDDDQEILQNYPYILAMPYDLMLKEKAPFQKLQLLKDLFLNYLKYLGLLTATEYFFSGIRNASINILFREKLFQPHFGHWNHFIRETLAELESEGHDFLIPELPAHYRSVQLDKKAASYTVESRYTDEDGEIKTVKKKMTAIDGLINFRNRYIGHGVTLSAEESTGVFELYFPMIKKLLKDLSFAVNYPFLRYRDGHVFRLMGLTPADKGAAGRKYESSETVWLELEGDRRLPLLPFFIPPEQYMADFSSSVQLFVYEQHTSRRILYFSPELSNGEAAGEPVAMFNRLLKDKEAVEPLEPGQLDSSALIEASSESNMLVMKELEQEQKVIKGIYQSRGDNEKEISSFLDSSSSFYFIAAEAGSGKTNLLAQTCRGLQDEGRPVLFLRGVRLESADLSAEVSRRLRLESSGKLPDAAAWNSLPGGSLVLLIDGLNEHQEPDAALSSLERLFELVPEGALKVIVSWRINSPEDFPEVYPEIEQRIFRTGGESRDSAKNILQRCAGSLKPFNRLELEQAWAAYSKSSKKIYKPQFSLAELEQKDRSFTSNLTNPLLLRLFLELYNGKGLSKKLRDIQIWPLWYRRITENIPGAEEFLMTLVGLMYESNSPEMDLDSLYDHPVLKTIVRQLDISSPYRKLLSQGVLSQYFKDGFLVISFTVEASYHYLLSRYIIEKGADSTVSFLLDVLKQKAGLRGIREAVGVCASEAAVSGDLTPLAGLIGDENGNPDICATALAKALNLGDAEAVIKELAGRAPSNCIDALAASDYILERNLQTGTRYNAFAALDEVVSSSNIAAGKRMRALLYYCRIAHEYGRYEQALELAIRLSALVAEEKLSDRLFIALSENRLAVAYRKLMRQVDEATSTAYGEQALEHARKALEIMEDMLPENDPELAAIYDTVGKVHEYRLEWSEAINYGRKRISVLEAAYGPWHQLLASAYNNTAIVLRENGDRDESVEFSRRAMEIVERALDPFHIEMAYAHWTLAYTWDKFGEPAKGVEEMETVLSILRKTLDEDHPSIASAITGLEEFKGRA